MTTKSKLDIIRLKTIWLSDPHWDIEDTKGFEDHYAELKAYRYHMEAKWDRKRAERIERQAFKLHCSIELAEYILDLERQVRQIKEKIYVNEI